MTPIDPNNPIDFSDPIDPSDPIESNVSIDPNEPIDSNDPSLDAAWGKRLLLPVMQRLSERVTQPGYTRIVLISLFCCFTEPHWLSLLLVS